jgi:subtilisin family serine protease/subtilisin-like proprotein convertase family protein
LGPALGLVSGLYEVQLTAGHTVTQALTAYRADPQVIDVQPDYLLSPSTVPNDPQFSQQWSLHNTGQDGGTPGADIHATGAWNVTTGNPAVVVAVLDSGIDYTDTDLYQNIWINQAEIPQSRMKNLVDVDHDGYISFADLNNPVNWGPYKIEPGPNGVVTAAQILAPMVLNAQGQDSGQGGWAYPGNTQDGDAAHPNDFIGWNFVTNTNNPFDDLGHGTAVAGIIGATGNNGVGIAGIDWQASLMPVKFISSQGTGTVSAFISALNYSVAHGARISNNSWDGAINDPFLELAIANAQSHGDIFVAAAGNDGSNNDTNPVYPASYPLDNIVAVAATDNNDHLAGFSNYGPSSVALAAPGVNILSTEPGNSYGTLSGTSVATPEVTGVLALVWGQHPSWTYQQVIHQVLSTVDPLPGLAGKVLSGGRLDAAAAVGASANAPQVLSSSVSGPSPNAFNDVRLTFSTAMNPSTLAAAVSLTGAAGQAIPVTIAAVANSGNSQFDVQFATQTAPGSYSLHVSAAAHDASGNALVPYQTNLTINPSFTFSSASATAIPAGSGGIAVSSLAVGQSLTVAQVRVQVNITYPDDSDLYIHLQAPDGTDVVLASRRGWNGANLQGTTFSDQAATPVASALAPLAGVYQPEAPLASFGGKAAQGTWKLWVENWGGSAAGTLNNWSLTITGAPNVQAAVQVAGVGAAPPSPATQTAPLRGPQTSTIEKAPGVAGFQPPDGDAFLHSTDVHPASTTVFPAAVTPVDSIFGSEAVMTQLRTAFLQAPRAGRLRSNPDAGTSDAAAE